MAGKLSEIKKMNYLKRNQSLREKLLEIELDGILVTRPENIFYLIGIDNIEGIYFLYPEGATLFTDFRYFNYLKEKDSLFEIIQCEHWTKDMSAWLKKNRFKKIGFESGYITMKAFNNWKAGFLDITLIPCGDFVEDLRLIKDRFEQEQIRKSTQILGEVTNKVSEILKNTSGITERDLAIELDYIMKKAGAQRSAFDIIAATGKRSAFPHSSPTDNIIENEDLLLIDCGVIYMGYHSDMTRVMVLKDTPNSKIQEIYDIVREAQKAAISLVSPGVSAKDIDHAAREIIKDAGFEDCFGHGTGHGVGLMIHEEPKINKTSESILKKGMVFTIEPGIYLENEFGVRWEDMVLVTDDGYEYLTDTSWDSLRVI
jgi:Xaa-Pro aminopeptidase